MNRILLKGKKPIESGWQKWCREKRESNPTPGPGEQLGIPTGPANGILVLDIDNLELFRAASRKHGWKIPETHTVETGRDLPHFYFQYPNGGRDYGNKSRKELGFDIRGLGGQVVAPGSIHPDTGKPYRVVKDIPLAKCPDWIVGLYNKEEKKEPPKTTSFQFSGDIQNLPIKQETKDLIINGVEYPNRSEAIMKVLNALVWSNLSDSEIYGIFDQYPIGEKYREQRNPEKWLQPQVEKARARVTDRATEKAEGSCQEQKNKKTKKTPPLIERCTLAELRKMEFPEPKCTVEGVLPEGTTIFGGKPKGGKSVLAYNLAVAKSEGGKALGSIQVEKSSVLYLALEDNRRRLQTRAEQMAANGGGENLHLVTMWPKMGQKGLELLERDIEKYEHRLVIIDTFKKFRPVPEGNRQLYDIDYESVDKIKQLSDRYPISILIIHHLRKMEAEDIFDTFSGTFGLTGACDCMMAFQRTATGTNLHIRGRDIEDKELSLRMDPQFLTWELLGNAEEVQTTDQKQTIFNVLKNNAGQSLSPSEIAFAADLDPMYVTTTVARMAKEGRVFKTGRGMYSLSPGGE